MTRVGLLCVVAGLAAAAPIAPQRPTFKARTDLVVVSALVSAGGKPVSGLSAADFELRDDGVVQEVRLLSGDRTSPSSNPLPLDVVLAFDTSGSMAGERLQHLTRAAGGVFDLLHPGDRASLITFAESPALLHAPSPDLGSVRGSLARLRAEGRTAMFDAIYAAIALSRNPGRRTMILLLTDGRDNASWLRQDEVREMAGQSDAVLYAVGLDADVTDQLKEMVTATGGELILTDAADRLAAIFDRAVGDMQSRYVLGYYPSQAPHRGWHKIELRVRGERADVVRVRNAYFMPE